MATQVQWRGGSTAEHATFTGAAREVTVDTQKQTLVVHDGSTVGGEALLREDQANLPGSVTNGIYTPSANQVAVATNGTGRLFVDASGRVGVGATPSIYRLDVGGNGIRTRESDDSSALVLGTYDAGGYVYISSDKIGTGSYQPLVFSTGGSERLRITSTGLVGIGTSSPGAKIHSLQASTGEGLRVDGDGSGFSLVVEGGTTYHTKIRQGSIGSGYFGNTPPTNGLIVEGSVGIGTTSPSSILHLKAASSPKLILDNSDSSTDAVIDTWWAGTPLAFQIGSSEKARIDASGRLLIGTSSDLSGGDADARLQVNGDAGAQVLLSRQDFGALTAGTLIGEVVFRSQASGVSETSALIKCEADATQGSGDKPGRLVFSTTADGAGVPTERMRIANSGTIYGFSSDLGFWQAVSAAAGSSQLLFRGSHSGGAVGTGTTSYYVYSNGNVQNTNGSYTAISDAKLKENIVDASSQWDDLKSIQIRNWNFKAETGHETHRQIGPIAQELETVCPGLVFETPDRDADGNETGEVTKCVNQSVLYMKAVKALQEAMERIEALEQRLTAAGID